MSIQEIMFAAIGSSIEGFPIQPVEPLNYSTREWIPSNLHSNSLAYFGQKVAISDDGKIMAVSSPGYANGAGAVYILNRASGSWVVEKRIQPYTTAAQYSGRGLALSSDGDLLCIGTPVFNSSRGVVNVYRRNGGAWTFVTSLTENIQETGNGFGWTISISRDKSTIAIASPTARRNTYECGAVSIFEWNGSTYIHKWFYREENPWPSRLGSSLTISDKGDFIVAGAPSYNANKGFIRLFQRTNNVWAAKTIVYHGGVSNSYFGNSVGMSGDGASIIVGAYGSVSYGEAMLYKRTGTTLSLEKLISSPVATAGHQFGKNVAISQDGTRTIVNAPFHTKENSQDGVFYIYQKEPSWSLIGSFSLPLQSGRRWAESISFSSNGRWLAAGNGNVNDGVTSNGSVYRVGA